MRKKFMLILLLLSVTAFAVRMVVSLDFQTFNHGDNAVVQPVPTTDMCTYMRLADQVARGEYHGVYYYQPFYYAVFLPVIKIIFGSSAWAVIFVQSLLGALTVYLGGLCTAKLWSKNGGIVAAVLLTFSGALIIYTPFHLIVTLQSFWMILLFYTLVLAIEYKNWRRWALVGLVYGCSILTCGNTWFFLPGLLYAAVRCQFYKERRLSHYRGLPWLRKVFPCLVLIVCTLLPQLPFVYNNTKVLGHLTGPSTASDNVMALGNTPEAPPGGREPEAGPGAMEYPTSYQVWLDPKTPKTYKQHLWEWIQEEPGAVLELAFRKMLLFWDRNEIPNNISYEWQQEQSNTFMIFGWAQTWIFIIMGLSGIICLFHLWKHNLKIVMLVYFIVAYWLSIAAFYILSRYRAPIIPLLAIFAAMFACYFWEKRKNPNNFDMVYYFHFPVLLAFFCISFFAYNFYRYHLESDVMGLARPYGVKLELTPARDMYLDNGPSTFGCWNFICFSTEMPLRKYFHFQANSKHYKSAEFDLTLAWETPGEAVFLINGHRFKVVNTKGKFGEEKFVIPFPNDGVVKIRLLSANTRVFYFLDFQRNYGRTFLGDIQPPAELVCRLICSTEPYSDPNMKAPEQPEKIDRNTHHDGESNLAMAR